MLPVRNRSLRRVGILEVYGRLRLGFTGQLLPYQSPVLQAVAMYVPAGDGLVRLFARTAKVRPPLGCLDLAIGHGRRHDRAIPPDNW